MDLKYTIIALIAAVAIISISSVSMVYAEDNHVMIKSNGVEYLFIHNVEYEYREPTYTDGIPMYAFAIITPIDEYVIDGYMNNIQDKTNISHLLIIDYPNDSTDEFNVISLTDCTVNSVSSFEQYMRKILQLTIIC